jgi:hypothetical protein
MVGRRNNGWAKAGFALSIIGLVLCWVPVAGVILLGLGFILSLVGLIVGLVGNRGIGFAITGLLISSVMMLLSFTVLMRFLENTDIINYLKP